MNVSIKTVKPNVHKFSTTALAFILGLASALVIANLYYTDIVVAYIAKSLDIPLVSVGWMMTFVKSGYLAGLIFVLPLADRVDNKKLLNISLVMMTISCLLFATATTTTLLFISAFMIGIALSANQFIILYAAYISNDSNRGLITGGVTSGLMLGIVFARTFAVQVVHYASWHWVYYFSATMAFCLILLLNYTLPEKKPKIKPSYLTMLVSLVTLFIKSAKLRRRCIYQSFFYALFIIFWMTLPTFLKAHFHLTANELSLFMLVSLVGVVTPLFAGYIADLGKYNIATFSSIVAVALSFSLPLFAYLINDVSLYWFVIAAILLDYGFTMHLTIGQKEILQIDYDNQARLNSVYRIIFFIGGVIGSICGTYLINPDSWKMTSIVALGFTFILFIYYLTEFMTKKS